METFANFWLLSGDVTILLRSVTELPVILSLPRWVTLVYRTAMRLVFEMAPLLSKLQLKREIPWFIQNTPYNKKNA